MWSLCHVTFWMGLSWLCFGSPAENMQLRRLWPVQPLAPCGQHSLGSQCESWHLVKSVELPHHNESPFFSSLFFSCLPFRRRLPPCCNNRIKNRSLFTEKWSNHPLHLASHWARRSSRSRRRWGNACRRSTAAPCQSRFALTLRWSAHKRPTQVFVEIPDNIQHYWHFLCWKRPLETKQHLSFVENGADTSESNKSPRYGFNPNSLQRALVKNKRKEVSSMFCKHLEEGLQCKPHILSTGCEWAGIFVLVTE